MIGPFGPAYDMKMVATVYSKELADFEYFRVLSVFSQKQLS